MSRETEKIFKDLGKHLSDKEIKSDEDYDKATREFMDMYNSKAPKKKGKDAWDFLDMAYEAESEQDALKYAKKALQLDKNCLDAEVMIVELTATDIEDLKLKYEKLITKTENYLKGADIMIDENIGHFWGIVETRPYMRLRYSYVNLLIDQGKFKMAIKECEELLVLSENDNLGARYKLFSLYAFLEDEVNVSKLYKRYKEEPSSQMLLAVIALYYKLDNYKKAESYLKKLCAINKEVAEVFGDVEGIDAMEIQDVIESGMYRHGGKEELMVAMFDSGFLYTTTSGLLLWIAERVTKKTQ